MTISVQDRFQTILTAIENSNCEDIDIVSEYGDHNRTLEEGKEAILLGNWNNFDKYPNIMEFLEKNYELEWTDEWVIDYDNQRCFRSSPDSYGYQPQFGYFNDEICSVEEINELDEEDFLEFLEQNRYLNNPKTAVNLMRFKERGTCIGEDEYMMFEKEIDPSKMLAEAQKENPEKDFYFVVDGVAQFGLDFSLYML
jgi:hypothetical protein